MAEHKKGGGMWTWLLLGGAGLLAYEWWKGQSTATAAPAAATTAAPINAAGAYTTQLTSQPPSAVVAAPVPATLPVTGAGTATGTGVCADGTNSCLTQVQPVATPAPVSTLVAASGPCSNSAYNALAAALQSLAVGDVYRDDQGNTSASAAAGTLSGWQWDYYVTTKLNGKALTGPSYDQMKKPMTVCDYVGLRAQYALSTGLSGMARLNVPMVFRARWQPGRI